MSLPDGTALVTREEEQGQNSQNPHQFATGQIQKQILAPAGEK